MVGGLRRLVQPASASQPTGVDRRVERVQVGLAGQRRVQRREGLGGVEQHPRYVATSRGVERDLGAQQREPGCLQGVQRPGRRGGQQVQGDVGGAGVVLGVRGLQRPPGPVGGVGGQLDGVLQEGGRGGRPAAGPGPAAERSRSAAASSSTPSTAWARCQARRSGSTSGSVATASAP